MSTSNMELNPFAILVNRGNFTENLSRMINSSTKDEDRFYFYQTEQVTFLCILFAFIVMGNSAVLIAIFLSNKRGSRMNFFIINLAIADLSVALLNVLPDTIWKITVEFMAGEIVCKIVKYLQGVVTYASTYVLVAMTVDRLDVIVRPMHISSGGSRAKKLIAIAWTVSVVFALPMISINNLELETNGMWQCTIYFPENWHWKLYITLIAIVLFIVPAISIAICYIVIVLVIRDHGKLRVREPHFVRRRLLQNGDSVPNGSSTFQQSSSSSRGVIPKAKIKTVKMTLVIVSVFILCWSPFFVYDLLDVYGQIPKTQQMLAVVTFIGSLAPLNSAANPIVYLLFNTRLCGSVAPERIRLPSPPQSTVTVI